MGFREFGKCNRGRSSFGVTIVSILKILKRKLESV